MVYLSLGLLLAVVLLVIVLRARAQAAPAGGTPEHALPETGAPAGNAPLPTEPLATRAPLSTPPAMPAAPRPAPVPSAAPAPLAPRGIVRGASPQISAMLQGFRRARAADLPAAERAAIAELLGRIPRPPSALHQLVSPDFLAQANTARLGEMVMAEPQVAARVLALVNSPAYGLRAPLLSIGQAVTFLGMNTVRGICLQYLLDESFQTRDPEVKRIFDGLWNASGLASELCFKLAQQLQLPEPGTLVTQVVLSFLGHVASHSLLPKKQVLALMARSLLERSRTEQEVLGLCAGEIGSLLMMQWALPGSIVERVRAIDLVLQTPCPAGGADAQTTAAAFCYLCARLGEKLARGDIRDLAAFRLEQETDPEFFFLQGYLRQGALARLGECLQSAQLVAGINAMAQALHVRG